MVRFLYGVGCFTQGTDRARRPCEWAMFPLAEDGETIDHCLLVEGCRPLDPLEAPEP